MKKSVQKIILKIQVIFGITILIASTLSIFVLYNVREIGIEKNSQDFLSQFQQLSALKGNLSNDTLFIAKYTAGRYWDEKDYIIRQGFVMQLIFAIIIIILSFILIGQSLIKIGENK